MSKTKEIYLIRHTTPAVARGICYGQTDLGVTATFDAEAARISQVLPSRWYGIHSSPLQRCTLLAERLFPGIQASLHPELMEINCGQWEMNRWDDLPPAEVEPWMKDFVQLRIPGGESYLDLHARVTRCFDQLRSGLQPGQPQAIVAHGGVLRSILSHITGTALVDSFKAFSLNYGCVIRIYEEDGRTGYEDLYNQASETREQHKPSAYYK